MPLPALERGARFGLALSLALILADQRRRASMHPFYPQDASRDAGDIFNGAPPGSQPQQMNFQQQLGTLQQQVNMDMLENILAMQDPQGQANQHGGHQAAGANPQTLLEHQLRLNQLQQLQQLQNQIFQQQVRS